MAFYVQDMLMILDKDENEEFLEMGIQADQIRQLTTKSKKNSEKLHMTHLGSWYVNSGLFALTLK